jgi:uncharacterized protein involved in exopolysaccharide biosynthesis
MEKNKQNAPYQIPTLTLRDMLGPLFRHRVAVILAFSAVFLTAVLVAVFWARNYYVTSMQIVVGRERIDPTVTSQPVAALQDSNRPVTTDDVASEISLLQGKDMLREVVQACNLSSIHSSVWDALDRRDPAVSKSMAEESATLSLAGKLDVQAKKDSRVIDVHFGSTRPPETTACVLQTLGTLYLEKHMRLQRPAGALDFFAQETDKYKSALADSEQQLVKFSEAQGVAAPDLVRSELARELVTAEGSLYQTRQAIAADRRRIEKVKNQMASTPSRSATTEASIAPNILLDQLQTSLLNAQLKRTQLLSKYDPSYPSVKELDQEIAQTQQAIASAEQIKYLNTTTDRDLTFEYLRQDQAKTQADLASEEARAVALAKTVHDIGGQTVSLDVKAVHQGALLRDAKANENNYLLYLTKREQERASEILDEKRIANVAIAVPPQVPVLPAHSPWSVVITGFWAAILCGICAGYLAELADSSLRTPSEVEDLLHLNVLAAVPKRAA